MYVHKHFPPMVSMLFFILVTLVGSSHAQSDNGKLSGKDPIYKDSRQNDLLNNLYNASGDTSCIAKCIKRNQMASVGFEVIQERCRQVCNIDDILDQVRSQDTTEYEKGVKALCEIDDPRAVQPLITALKRDIKVRTGLWSCIIPALGKLKDPAAIPLLEHTLTISDDHWLGREMSAIALGNIGSPESIPVLLDVAERGDIRGSVIKAMAKINDHRVIPTLISALQAEEDPETSQTAMNALKRFGSRAVPELISAFEDFTPEYSDTQKRLRLCHLLGNSSDKRAIERLHKSLKDPDAVIGKCAFEYVGNK